MEIDGRDWIVAPDGMPFFAAGVCHVHANGSYSHALGYSPYKRFVAENYPSLHVWADETAARLRDWGFTSLGAACDTALLAGRGFPHVSNSSLRMGQSFASTNDEHFIMPWKGAPCTALPNVFHPDFPAHCDRIAAERCAAAKDDPWLIGWYIDNELAWWGQNSQRTSGATGVFDAIMEFPPEHSARRELERFLAAWAEGNNGARHETRDGKRDTKTRDCPLVSRLTSHAQNNSAPSAAPREIPLAVKLDFLRHFARTYFETTTAAIRRHDPNHLILGCRFAGLIGAHPVVWEEAGRFCDVVSFNCYPWADLDCGVVLDEKCGLPMTERFAEYHGYARRPIIVSEWSFPALDTGRPCFKGAGQRVPTQKERAAASALFLRTMLAQPFIVGCEYFMWCDRPAQGAGKANAEDCNYGLVSEENRPYEELLAALSPILREADALREGRASPPGEPQRLGGDASPHHPASERERYFAEANLANVKMLPMPVFNVANAEQDWKLDLDTGNSSTMATSYVLSNAFVRIRGRVGSKYAADEIAFSKGGAGRPGEPVPVGRMGSMLQLVSDGTNDWIDTDRVTGVTSAIDEATGIASVEIRMEGGAAFAITIRLSLAPSAHDILAEIVSVENLGDRPIVAWLPFLRPWSLDEKPVAVPKVLDRWGVPCEAEWQLPDGGVWGISSSDPSAKRFRFFVDPKGGQHPDARFAPCAPALQSTGFPRHPSPPIAPGETWRPSVPTGARIYRKAPEGGVAP